MMSNVFGGSFSTIQLLKKLVQRPSHGVSSAISINILQQTRNATKKASGSKTSMKDSAGRRLGPKKGNGSYVEPGQIIYRQRGTKFYPGENCSIGKDHTIFAMEHGWVQYYLDPFHPKRSLIGVSIQRENKLPTPHFEPRIRRFGRHVIRDENLANKEETKLTRKQFFSKDELTKSHEDRSMKRGDMVKDYQTFLTKQFPENNEFITKNMETIGKILILIRSNMKQGFSRDESIFNTLSHFKHLTGLNSGINQQVEEEEIVKKFLNEFKEKIDFNYDFEIVRYMSKEEKSIKQVQVREKIRELLPNIFESKNLAQVKKILNDQDLKNIYNKSEFVKFKRSIIKPVLPESVAETVSQEPGKGYQPVRRFNYKTNEIDTIYRKKESFTKTL